MCDVNTVYICMVYICMATIILRHESNKAIRPHVGATKCLIAAGGHGPW